MLGEALRLIRAFHDLSQTEGADKLGISKSYLSEIESGRKEPTLQLVKRYSDVYELPTSSIMFFSENLDRGSSYDEARGFVAGKIIALLRFLDERASRNES
jgi:transcriptional regulator with XRE-family HTH domain